MKRSKRYVTVLPVMALTFAGIFSGTAFAEETNEDHLIHLDFQNDGYTVSVEEENENMGMLEFLCDESGDYEFSAQNSENVSWTLVLTGKDEEESKMQQAESIRIQDTQILYLEEGWHLYLACTDDREEGTDETACLEIKKSEFPQETGSEIRRLVINDEPFTLEVSAQDGFDDFGITELLCEESDSYSFHAVDSEGIVWNIYLLDERFDDAWRFLPQAEEAALEGDGILNIEAGQYIYIECSENPFTTDIASDCAYLQISRAEGNEEE